MIQAFSRTLAAMRYGFRAGCSDIRKIGRTDGKRTTLHRTNDWREWCLHEGGIEQGTFQDCDRIWSDGAELEHQRLDEVKLTEGNS